MSCFLAQKKQYVNILHEVLLRKKSSIIYIVTYIYKYLII